MSRLSERSVMHIFGVTMMLIMTLMIPLLAATHESSPSSSSSSSSSSSPTSFSFHQAENNEQYVGAAVEDYGVWDPTPDLGGAYASPVPHAELDHISPLHM
ncbi:hypothetical protein V6N13_058964 [Hibiscus sabdariffa]|uniref:Uncharacterized protein n=1 Tax=Hibiscus sabdariffa TaxID=183260 RepID=A0ABR2GF47_9ROSI